jgi:hypothetical protein
MGDIKKLKTHGGRLAAAALIAAGSLAVGAGTAQADAYSCTGYGGYQIPRTGIGLAQFCAQTKGSGTWVASIGAGFSSPIGPLGLVCDGRLKVDFVDNYGRVYATYFFSQYNGCWNAVGGWKLTINKRMRAGHVNYTLLSQGATIAVVRHRIG